MEAISKEIATSKNLKAGDPEVAAEAAAEVIEATEVEEAATEVAADKIIAMMEAHLGAEEPELATEVELALVVEVAVATKPKKVVVASDQRLLAHQVAAHQWLKRVVALEPWCTFPTSDSK